MGGGGSTYDYGFRIYNAQLGKFLSMDPLTASYPWYTPYQFAGNKPIWAIDLDGLEETFYTIMLESQLDDYANGRITEEEFVKNQQVRAGASTIIIPVSIISTVGSLFGWATAGTYFAEEIVEEIAGVPVFPDPGDAVQTVVKKQFAPLPSTTKTVSTNQTPEIISKKIIKTLPTEFKFRSGAASFNHYRKHVYGDAYDHKKKKWKPVDKGPDLPYMSYNEYKFEAIKLMKSDGDNILTHISKEGTIFKYDKTTGYFGISDKDGTITTFYKPKEGENYFNKQIIDYP
jgi:hypothetical protein